MSTRLHTPLGEGREEALAHAVELLVVEVARASERSAVPSTSAPRELGREVEVALHRRRHARRRARAP